MNNELYHDRIVEWSKKADHSVKLENANCSATASNPLCGDKISVELEFDGNVIKSISCRVKGCMLCKASCSVLAERARGLRLNEITAMNSELAEALKSSTDDPASFPEGYGMFLPVRSHKSRHSCVMLPFTAVLNAVSECRKAEIVQG